MARRLTLVGKEQPMPYRRTTIAVSPAPLLTIERAISDGISPQQLLAVAAHNERNAKGNRRILAQADHLRSIAADLSYEWRRAA